MLDPNCGKGFSMHRTLTNAIRPRFSLTLTHSTDRANQGSENGMNASASSSQGSGHHPAADVLADATPSAIGSAEPLVDTPTAASFGIAGQWVHSVDELGLTDGAVTSPTTRTRARRSAKIGVEPISPIAKPPRNGSNSAGEKTPITPRVSVINKDLPGHKPESKASADADPSVDLTALKAKSPVVAPSQAGFIFLDDSATVNGAAMRTANHTPIKEETAHTAAPSPADSTVATPRDTAPAQSRSRWWHCCLTLFTCCGTAADIPEGTTRPVPVPINPGS